MSVLYNDGPTAEVMLHLIKCDCVIKKDVTGGRWKGAAWSVLGTVLTFARSNKEIP